MNADAQKRPIAVIGDVLLGDQSAWIADNSRVKVWEKSRRIGASWTDAADSVLKAGAINGCDCLYIGYSEDFTREYIDACAEWSMMFQFAITGTLEFLFDDTNEHGETRQIKAFRIDYASGYKIIGLSSRPRSIRGKQGKVTIDEAAYHDDLPGLLKAALALLMWGGQVCVLSSHFGEDNDFNILVKEIRAGKWPYSLHKTTFMGAIQQGLYRRVCLRTKVEWSQEGENQYVADMYAFYGANAAEEMDCVPSAGSGVYLPRTIVERCMDAAIPVVRYSQKADFVLQDDRLEITKKWFLDHVKPLIDALPPDKRTCAGQDFGRSGDLSAFWPFQDQGAGNWRQCFSLEMRNIPFDCQQLLIFLVMDELPLLHHVKFDARGNGQSHAEAALQKYGLSKVECVMLTEKWYAEFFPKYKAAFEDKSITVALSEDIIADHRRVILDKGRPKIDQGKDKGSDGGDRHGDTAVAGVLAWAATLVEGIAPAGASVAANEEHNPSAQLSSRHRASMFKKKAA